MNRILNESQFLFCTLKIWKHSWVEMKPREVPQGKKSAKLLAKERKSSLIWLIFYRKCPITAKNLLAVVETVEKLQADIQHMKRKYLSNTAGTSKKWKSIETSENEASSGNDDNGNSSRNNNPENIANIFSEQGLKSEPDESNDNI